MTIGECVTRADKLRPNDIREEEKVTWADELDRQLRHEFFPRYKTEDGAGVQLPPTSAPPTRTQLLAGSGPFEEMYVYYVAAKIDLACQEMESYALDAALLQSAIDNYRKDYNRTHTHV